MGKRERNPKLQELFDKNIPVYSYSKLSSWDGCKYNWYKSYILHERGKNNIYSEIGGIIHDSIEAIYQGEGTLEDAKNNFNKKLKECKSKGIDFPQNPSTTKINYLKNIDHFFNNYTIIDTKMQTEFFVLYKIPRMEFPKEDKDYIWIQMYIDSIIPVYDENNNFVSVIVNDWKTSSKFDKEKLKSGGRQLLLYKLGLEQYVNTSVSSVGWTMLKYVYCCYITKGSKKNPPQLKKSMQQRKDAVKYFKKKAVDFLIQSGLDTIKAEIEVANAINKNDMSLLPEEFRKNHWIEDCFLEYELTEEAINECLNWVVNTVNEIESNEVAGVNKYKPKQINESNQYFCFNLCGRSDCIYLTKYKQENIVNFKKKKKEKQINKLFNNNTKLDIDSLFK